MKRSLTCCPLPLTSMAIPLHLLKTIFNLDHANNVASTMTPQAAKPLNERSNEQPHGRVSLIYTIPTYTTCTTTVLNFEQ